MPSHTAGPPQELIAPNASQTIAFPIAIAGEGKGFKEFTRLFCRADFTDGVPHARITAMLGISREACMGAPCLKGLPIYDSPAELFAQHPGLRMVIDLSDDNHFIKPTRDLAPPDCSIVTTEGANLLQDILASEHLCHTCIRELRRAQNLFATLIDQIDEDILLLDHDGTILDINAAALERLGGTKAEHLGKTCDTLHGNEFHCPAHDTDCPLRETLETGSKADRLHTRVLDDGKMQYFRIYTYPVFGPDGRIARIIELRRDITGRTNMEQKLQQAEKMAAIGELATYIAHEIRNPLFAIGGFANSLLRSPKLDESLHSKVEVILEESRRLDKILKTTLNFARPTARGAHEIDLNTITAETLQLMQLGCKERGLTAKVQLADNIAIATGNPDMLKQCLINLVKNAMEAMEQGGQLTVTTGMTRTHVFVRVEDTGTGIPAELRENVFSPFFSTKGEGAGLGLAMTKKIIDEMGGYVDLLSQEEQGTSVTLYLLPMPAVKNAEAVDIPTKDFSDAVLCGQNGDNNANCSPEQAPQAAADATPVEHKDPEDGANNSTGNEK